jgi:hypothetical protein
MKISNNIKFTHFSITACFSILFVCNIFGQNSIEILNQQEPFTLLIQEPFVWNESDRDAFNDIIAQPRFNIGAINETFTLTNLDQLRLLKDMLDVIPSSRVLRNNEYVTDYYEQDPCLTENYNNAAQVADQFTVNYKLGGYMYANGVPRPYPFAVTLNSVCTSSLTYPMVINEASKVGFGTNTPQAQYHFTVPDFQIGDNTKLQFKISNTTNNESMVFSKGTQQLFKINKDGKVFAREIEINLTNPFPDYVFAKEYNLMSLNEVDAFIQINKHLPGIEPAATYEKEGVVNLGEIQLKLLEKVEELTLYVIQQQKEIEALKATLAVKK